MCGFLMFFTLNVLAWGRYGRTLGGDMSILHLDINNVMNDDTNLGDHLIYLRNSSCKEKILKTTYLTCLRNTDLNSAIEAMTYHRQMMKKYMLSEYLAKQFVASISEMPTDVPIGKRIGLAKNELNEPLGNNSFLSDEGSYRYLSWLKRLTELDNKRHGTLAQKQILAKRRYMNSQLALGDEDYDGGLEYIEEADITGYAYSPNENSTALFKDHKRNIPMEETLKNSLNMLAISKTGYDDGRDIQRFPPPQVNTQSFVLPVSTSESITTKEIGLKDITDIALTTLAFLSFGMFILQVLMCITMNKEDTNTLMMLPMESTNNEEVSGEGTEEIRRKRRSIISQQHNQKDMINILTEIALFSIDSVTSADQKNNACHYYSLCESNKLVQLERTEQKVWVPIWSLAISWFITRINALDINYKPISGLKALMTGLNGGDCSFFHNSITKLNGC